MVCAVQNTAQNWSGFVYVSDKLDVGVRAQLRNIDTFGRQIQQQEVRVVMKHRLFVSHQESAVGRRVSCNYAHRWAIGRRQCLCNRLERRVTRRLNLRPEEHDAKACDRNGRDDKREASVPIDACTQRTGIGISIMPRRVFQRTFDQIVELVSHKLSHRSLRVVAAKRCAHGAGASSRCCAAFG